MTAWNTLLDAGVVERLGWTLLHSVWQLAALAALAGLLLRAARHGSPQVRYLVACATLLVMLVLPVATYCTIDAALLARTPPARLSEVSTSAGGARASSGTPDVVFRNSEDDLHESGVAAGESVRPSAASEPSSMGLHEPVVADTASAGRPDPATARDWPAVVAAIVKPSLPWLAFFWGAGFSLLSMYHLGGWFALGRMRRRATQLAQGRLDETLARWAKRLGVRRGVGLLESAAVRVPTVAGWLRPVILLPAGLLSGLSAAEVEAIVVHELVHIRRWDYLVNLLQTAAESLLFYHPVAWWISHRIRVEREYCVDAAAAAASGDRLVYAKALAALEEQCGRLHHLAMAATGGRLRRRIQYLLCGPPSDGPRHGTLLTGTLAALVLVGAMVLLPAAQSGGSLVAPEPSRDRKGAVESPTQSPPSDDSSRAGPLPHGRGSASTGTVLHVAADGSQPYRSIQKAIDAAPAGATIKIAAGTYDEQLTIAKPLTLEGAGWDKTLIRSTDNGKAWFSKEWEAEYARRFIVESSPEARRKMLTDVRQRFQECQAVVVHDTRDVELRALRFSMPGHAEGGGVPPMAAVKFRKATVRLVDSAVVDCVGSGIDVGHSSDVEIRRCLVAGVCGRGIAIHDDSPIRAKVLDSDVRNCVYAGITIRGGEKVSVEVARCRISGASWHGIRYDETSPNIHNNWIFDNARCGIYASGKTAAVVRDNVFYGNTMDGMSCWFENEDSIEGNTFARNEREGLMIIDQSKPLVRHNIFFANGNAIEWGFTEDVATTAAAEPRHIEQNLFWHNKAIAMRPNPEVARQIQKLQEEFKAAVRRPAVAATSPGRLSDAIAALQKKRLEKVPLDPQWGNVEVDPRFVNPQKQDYSLAADSPARKAAIGAVDPLAPTSPWPVQPEEKECAPQPAPAAAAVPGASGGAPSGRGVDTSTLVKEIQQRKDKALRQRGLDRLRELLAPDATAAEHRAGLIALRQVMAVRFDRGPFRPLVIPLLNSPDAQIRAMAVAGLAGLAAKPEDLALVVPMVDDVSPEVRAAAGTVLILIGQGQHEEQVIPALMKVLRDPDPKVVTQVIRSMWGQYSSPEFDELLIKLSRDEAYHHIVIYHALSTMQRKSVAVCRRLVEELDDPDWNNSGRAAWGLTYGVIDKAKPIVEKGLLAALPEETNYYTRGEEFRALGNVATEKSRAYLESVVDSEMETGRDIELAREILKRLNQIRGEGIVDGPPSEHSPS